MTLSTDMVVIDPVPIDELFNECRRLLGADESHPFTDEWEKSWCSEPPSYVEDRGSRERRHPAGLGLPALLAVHYAVEAPLPTKAEREQIERDISDYPDDAEDYDTPRYRTHFARIWFDTAYGYTSERGAGCSDLHAWLMRELGRWLEARGKRYAWRQEFTGDWFDSWEKVAELGDADLGALR